MIFGIIPPVTEDQMIERLEQSFRYLVKLVHPDRAPDNLKIKANEVFHKLQNARQAAEQAVKDKTYDKSFKAGGASKSAMPDSIISSSLGQYTFGSEPLKTGDFSVLYNGTASYSADPVLIKVASDPTFNTWLEKEATICNRVANEPKLARLKPYVTEVKDTFIIQAPDSKQYRVTVMPYNRDKISVSDILDSFKGKIPVEHAAWIARRVIAQAAAAAKIGVVHGAITPDHVLVDPIKHDPLHIGWGHAVLNPSVERITHVIDKWKDIYPAEVFNKDKPTESTDIYMAGKVIILLFGGNVKTNSMPKTIPPSIVKVIEKCVDPYDRYTSSLQVMEDLTNGVRAAWGRKYRALNVFNNVVVH